MSLHKRASANNNTWIQFSAVPPQNLTLTQVLELWLVGIANPHGAIHSDVAVIFPRLECPAVDRFPSGTALAFSKGSRNS